MSLVFIVGEPGSGKSCKMTDIIRKKAESGSDVTVIVPEQFSSASEHRLYNALGISLYNRIHVETFTRIRRNILKKNRDIGGNIPGEAAKTVIMYEVRRRLAGADLKAFGRQIGKAAFTSVCLDIVRELEMNGVCADDLDPQLTDNAALSGKLHDIRLICENYSELLTEAGFRTAASDGEEIAECAAETGFFKNTLIFIDGFKSFTADQLRLIGVMKGQCTVTVCMPTPYTSPNSSPVFSSVNETMNDICGDDVPDIIYARGSENRFSAAPDIGILSRSVLRDGEAAAFASENIHIAYASDISGEADYVCADISRKVRSGKYSYSDIAVVSRDFEGIRSTLADSFYRYNIPYFMDYASPAVSRPLCIFIMTLLEAASAKNPSSEMLFRILKTGFTAVSESHISELEAYCTEHGIEKESFKGSPICKYDGEASYTSLKKYDELSEQADFIIEADDSEMSAASVLSVPERAELIRRTVMLPLKDFRDNCGSSLRSITESLCTLLNGICVQSGELEDTAENREGQRIRKLMEKTLQNIADVPLNENSDNFTLKEYRDIFGMIISKLKLSAPAQTINCVSAASSDRARLDAPKAVYIMGAAEGFFPYAVSENGIFSEKELEILEEALGIKFNERIFRMAAEENFIAVSCIAAPSKELTVTCSFSDSAGKPRSPSVLTEKIAELAGTSPVNIPSLPAEFFITTPRSAYSEYVGNISLSPEKAAAAREAYFEDISDIMLTAESCREDILRGNILKHRISETAAKKLYTGKNNALNISASRLEDYAKCPFMFFCKKGLKLENVKKHEFSPGIRGNTVHEIMQVILSDIIAEAEKMKIGFNERISQYTKEDFEKAVHLAAENFYNREFVSKGFDCPPSFVRSFFYQERVITDILLHTQREFSYGNSRFRPSEFEFPIGLREGGIPSVKFTVKTESGASANAAFSGSVDRIDVFTDKSSGSEKNYLRVVDYKTGHKKFDFKTLLEGINMQMLLYLYAVTEKGGNFSKYSKFLPAGVMYAPSYSAESGRSEDGRPVPPEEAENTALKIVNDSLKMSGFVISDVNIIRAMEYKAEGVYIPQKLNTENVLDYITQKGTEMARSSRFGQIIFKFANSVSKDPLTVIKLTAELCGYTANMGKTADNIAAEYCLDDNAGKELENVFASCSNANSDTAFVNMRDEFLTLCGVFSRFDECVPDTDGVRDTLNEKFTEKSGRTEYPDKTFSLTENEYKNIMNYAENKMKEICSDICSGKADAKPLFSVKPCDHCDFRSVCVNGVPDFKAYRYPDKTSAQIIDSIRKGDEEK